jgi:hypothetical protein
VTPEETGNTEAEEESFFARIMDFEELDGITVALIICSALVIILLACLIGFCICMVFKKEEPVEIKYRRGGQSTPRGRKSPRSGNRSSRSMISSSKK